LIPNSTIPDAVIACSLRNLVISPVIFTPALCNDPSLRNAANAPGKANIKTNQYYSLISLLNISTHAYIPYKINVIIRSFFHHKFELMQ
jgi:hypothetical protein